MNPTLDIPTALANDDLVAAKVAASETMKALGAVDMKLLEGHAHMEWMKRWGQFKQAGKLFQGADLKGMRKGLVEFSAQLPDMIKQFGLGDNENLYVLLCPMAAGGKGAIWLQRVTRQPGILFTV